jgi:8-oxo-dGTP pyrophosphatase MutT (NUDIX family)
MSAEDAPVSSCPGQPPATVVQPFLAASLILLDRSDPSRVKILMGRRNQSLAFLPGKFVFPGGRFEPEDAAMAHLGSLSDDIFNRLRAPSTGAPVEMPAALALTGFRELFEETGYLAGTPAQSPVSTPAGTAWEVNAKTGIIPDLSKVHYVARALTPPHKPRRFNTHFFAIDATEVAMTIDGHVHAEAELVELRWVTFAEVAALDAIPVTQFIAAAIEKRLAGGLRHGLPVPYYYMQDEQWICAEL